MEGMKTIPAPVKVVCRPNKALHTQDSPEEAKAFAAGAQAMLEHMAQHVSVFIRNPIEAVRLCDFESDKAKWQVQWRVGAMGGTPGKHMMAPNSPDLVYGFERIDPTL